MATVRIYYKGTVSNPDSLGMSCRYNKAGSNGTVTSIFGADSWKIETSEHLPMRLIFRNKDVYKNINCFYSEITHEDEKKVQNFVQWAKGHPNISVPDYEGNELNEIVSSKSINAQYVLVDMDEQIQKSVLHHTKITNARKYVLDLFEEDRMKLWDLSWHCGNNPLGKTIEDVFVHLNNICMNHPSSIINFDTITDSELIDLALRKASFLVHPRGSNIMVTNDGRYFRMYDVATSYASIEGLREDLKKSPERLTELLNNVEKASISAFNWASNPKRKASDMSKIGAPDVSVKKKLENEVVTEGGKNVLSDYEADILAILNDDDLLLDAKKKACTKVVNQAKKFNDEDKVIRLCEDIMLKHPKTINNFSEWFEGKKSK